MKKNSFLLFAFLLSLFAIFSCGGGGGGGGSSDSSGVLTNLPAGGLQWTLNDSKQHILGRPVFDGENFVALGQMPTTNDPKGNGSVYYDGSFLNHEPLDTHVYESQDGIVWEDTTTVKMNDSIRYEKTEDLTSFPNEVYLWGSVGGIEMIRVRQTKGKWQEMHRQALGKVLVPVIGPDNGPYYGGISFLSEHMFSSRNDTRGTMITYEPDPGFEERARQEFVLGNNEILKLSREYEKSDVYPSVNAFVKVRLFRAPLGDAHLKLVKKFPSLVTALDGANTTTPYTNLAIAYGKGAYLVGVGDELSADPVTEKDAAGYGPRFYSSQDLDSWSVVTGLQDFSKYFQAPFGTNVYQLDSISYAKGVFVVFINEGSYRRNGHGARAEQEFMPKACYVLSSTDLKTFQRNKFDGLFCYKSTAFFAQGRIVLTMAKKAGDYNRDAEKIDLGRPAYRLVTITAPVP